MVHAVGILAVPIIDGRVSSPFGNRKDPFGEATGEFHKGIDFAAPIGTAVLAAAEGVVDFFEENNPTAGNFIVIRHPDGTKTRYLHLSRILIPKIGLKVNARQAIGQVGMTGRATGPHLHFDYQDRNGKWLDPSPMLGFVSLAQDSIVKSAPLDKFPALNFGIILAVMAGAVILTGGTSWASR